MKSILSLLIVLFSITSLFAQNVCTVKILFTINKSNPPSYTFKTDPQTTGAKYSWAFGDETFSDSPTPTHTFSKGGSYVIHVKVTTGTGTAATTCYGELSGQFDGGAVTPAVPCTVKIVSTKNSTPPVSYTFKTDPQKTGGKYSWTFGDNTISDSPTPSHTFSKAGTYSVLVKVTGVDGIICYGELKTSFDGGTVTTTVVTYSGKGKVKKTTSTDGCGLLITMDNGKMLVPKTMMQNFEFKDGQYVELTYELQTNVASGCSSGVSAKIIKIADITPVVTPIVPCKVTILATKNSTNPLNYSFKTDPASTASTAKYLWTFGDGTPNSDTKLPSHTFAKAGTYVIHVYVTTGTGQDAKICYGEMSVQVNTTAILPNCKGPINLLLFDPTNNLCNGSATVKLLDEAGKEIPNVKYLWSDGRTGSSAGTLCPGKLYTVQATIENVCQKTTSFTLLSKPLWQSTSVDGVNNFTVLSPVDGVQYEWNFGNGVTKIGPSVSYNFQKDGIYAVQLKAVSLDGVSASTKQVVVMKSVATTDVINKSEVDLYPNPAKEIIRVDFKNPAEGTLKVEIRNLSGRSVYIEQITNDGSSHADINIQNLNAGMYVLRISNDQRIIGEKKFIKTN